MCRVQIVGSVEGAIKIGVLLPLQEQRDEVVETGFCFT